MKKNILSIAAMLLLTSCWGGYYDTSGWDTDSTDTTGGGGVTVTSCSGYCDENYSTWDDYFFFEITVSGSASRAWVELSTGYSVNLSNSGGNYWEGNVAADDINSDCDSAGMLTINCFAE